MASSRAKLTAWTVVALLVMANLALAFPFWLDSPTRSNPHDPKSILFPKTPAATNTPAGPAPTHTFTRTPTATHTPLGTFTDSPTPAPTFTPTPSFTNTPVFSPTNTPAGTNTPSPTPTSGIVDAFEGGASRDQTLDDWASPVDMVCDGGSTIFAQPGGSTAWVANSGSTPGNTGTYCAHITGNLAGNPAGAFAYFATELNGTGFASDTDLTSSGYSGVSFDFKAGVAGVLYSVNLVQQNVLTSASPTAYYQYQFTPADTAWHTYKVYFPPALASPDGYVITQFNQPNAVWVTPVTFSKKIGAIMFSPVVQSSAVAYDMSIDNVAFVSTAAPVVPPVDTNISALVDSMENTAAEGELDALGPYVGNAATAAGACTIVPAPGVWPDTTYSVGGCPVATDPLSGSVGMTAYKHISGNIPTSSGTYANCQWSLVSGGYGFNTIPGIDFTGGQGPHNRLVFDAMSTATPASTYYAVQIDTGATDNNAIGNNAGGYNFYTASFAPTATWQRFTFYLPGQPYGPQFVIQYGGQYPWTANGVANDVQSVLFIFGNSTTSPTTFDLSLDNIRFD